MPSGCDGGEREKEGIEEVRLEGEVTLEEL